MKIKWEQQPHECTECGKVLWNCEEVPYHEYRDNRPPWIIQFRNKINGECPSKKVEV